MGQCQSTKVKTKSLIRLIKIEDQQQSPQNQHNTKQRIIKCWIKLEKNLTPLVNCSRTELIHKLKDDINIIIRNKNNIIQINDNVLQTVLDLMEQIALMIEELIREELLSEEASNKFHQLCSQILSFSMLQAQQKLILIQDKTQAHSFN